jgi:hypothetical protein
MILIIGNDDKTKPDIIARLTDRGYHLAGNEIVEPHIHAVNARTIHQLNNRIGEYVKPIILKDALNNNPHHDYETYVKNIDALNNQGPWLLNDFRPLFFFAEFKKLVGQIKVVEAKTDDETQFHPDLNTMAKKILAKEDYLTVEGELDIKALISFVEGK